MSFQKVEEYVLINMALKDLENSSRERGVSHESVVNVCLSRGVAPNKLKRELKKVIKRKKELIQQRDEEIKKIEAEFKEKIGGSVYDFERALSFIDHKYELGEYVFCYIYGELRIAKIIKHLQKGYKVLQGRKGYTVHNISFKAAVCLAGDTKRAKQEILLNNI